MEKEHPVDQFYSSREKTERQLEVIFQLLDRFNRDKHKTGKSRDIIQYQTDLRSAMDCTKQELLSMRNALLAQEKLRHGSISPYDLKQRRQCLEALESEYHNIQDYQRSGYVNAYQRLVHPSVTLNDLDSSLPSHNPRKTEEVTDKHRQGLRDITEKDHFIDNELRCLEAGSATLKGVARQQNEEAKLHNLMLEGMDGRMDSTKEKAFTTNRDLKKALQIKKRKRSCEVIATNVFCTFLSVALLAVLVLLLISSN